MVGMEITGRKMSTIIFIAVNELFLTCYYIGETILITMIAHYGNLIQVIGSLSLMFSMFCCAASCESCQASTFRICHLLQGRLLRTKFLTKCKVLKWGQRAADSLCGGVQEPLNLCIEPQLYTWPHSTCKLQDA